MINSCGHELSRQLRSRIAQQPVLGTATKLTKDRLKKEPQSVVSQASESKYKQEIRYVTNMLKDRRERTRGTRSRRRAQAKARTDSTKANTKQGTAGSTTAMYGSGARTDTIAVEFNPHRRDGAWALLHFQHVAFLPIV